MPISNSQLRGLKQQKWYVRGMRNITFTENFQVYERGVASITNSADLWTNYCSFKTETSHDPDVIRE